MKIQTLLRHGRSNAPAPGTPAWRRYLTASKISAVMRTSPWQTRFQLWHEMAGNIQPDPPHPAVLERGHTLRDVGRGRATLCDEVHTQKTCLGLAGLPYYRCKANSQTNQQPRRNP